MDHTTARSFDASPPPLTEGVYADLASLIVDYCNETQVQLDLAVFIRFTINCDLSQREAVALALPTWAQRAISLWDTGAVT